MNEINPNYVYLFDQLDIDFDEVKSCVETGTYEGVGSFTFSTYFDEVVTIELAEGLHRRCLELYKEDTNITFIQGKSTDNLTDVVAHIQHPYLLFLDAHGSGGNTVFDPQVGTYGSPVLEELECVKSNLPSWIIIDDLREFDDPNKNYPSREQIVKKVAELGEYEDPIAVNVGDPDHWLFGIPQWYCFKLS
tara:strand:- start:4241 stop:4813 length:573 start_codon:yes stop_codon:yes gene_type:complete